MRILLQYSFIFLVQLRPLDFVELSLACRFLHWRMFTFCTCYAPYTIRMEIIDDRVKEGLGKYQAAPKMFYRKKGEYGGLFVLQPSCLKRPFFFETLELSLEVTRNLSFAILIRYFFSYALNFIHKP